MIYITDDLIWELQDLVERGNRMLARLCEKQGIDPEQAGRLPAEPAADERREAA